MEMGNNKVRLMQFFATWCAPCKVLTPIVNGVEKAMRGQLEVDRIDIESNVEITTKYNIRAVPTLILTFNSIEVWRHVGMIPQPQLEDILSEKIVESYKSKNNTK